MPIFAVGYINYGIQGGRRGDAQVSGAPGKPSVSGFAGERRSSGATALSALKAETKDAELATTWA